MQKNNRRNQAALAATVLVIAPGGRRQNIDARMAQKEGAVAAKRLLPYEFVWHFYYFLYIDTHTYFLFF